ncbi:MAG: DUF1854 domain-containing protein [Burkholderiaceae bacterium]|uniref:cyanophycin metabolism-associated DUF1854 family protein n=1 Tax=Herminiimonas sp. Marseille-P9896 TaxID=2742211 RepID=UPI00158A17DF|nr:MULTISPECIES: DUF1854 domain-containing protein [Oxalobacteraceae]MBX9798579.1 DUF1854 domain-containing protein [Burkholderiaceae bacterium]
MSNFQLTRNAFGKLIYSAPGEEAQEGVVPVRSFPIAAPDIGIAIVSPDGHELVWIEKLSDLPEATRLLLEEELASREFLPEIKQIKRVSVFASPSTWTLATNRGDATLVLKGEEDIRRIGDSALLIADTHGIQFLIRDLNKLDKTSRKLLDRFL